MYFMLQVSATRCPPLSRTIPFGMPVVPDVYRMYSGSVAATGTQSAGCAFAINSDHSTSRPATIAARSCGRWRMMQRFGLAEASSIALSRSGLYGTTRLGSMPHEADTRSEEHTSELQSHSDIVCR